MALPALLCAGCASYVTPGGPAASVVMSSDDPGAAMTAPILPVPATVALVRVQAADYTAVAGEPFGTGAFTVLVPPKPQPAVADVASWPLVGRAELLSPDRLPLQLTTLDDLRLASAKSLADVMIAYTVDTQFDIDGQALPPRSSIKTGKAPGENTTIQARVSGVVVDVRTGYRYATVLASATSDDLDGAWLTGGTLDRRRLAVEQDAVTAFLTQAAEVWGGMAARSGTATAALK